jgi:outer membrane protein TolC
MRRLGLVLGWAGLSLCLAGGAHAQRYDLAAVVAMALQRNPDMAIATQRIGQAEAQLGQALSAFYPQLTARLQYARTDNPAQAFAMILAQRRFTFDQNFNHPGPTQDVRPEIAAVFPLFRGGQDFFRARAALHGLRAAERAKEAVRNGLIDTAAAAYLALLTAPQHVTVAEASTTAVQRALELARSRSEAGTGLRSDVLSLQARLAEAHEAKLRAENAVELARASLRTILAIPPEEPLEVAPSEEQEPLAMTFEQALERARGRRAELKAAEEAVAASEAELRAERAAYLPRVDLMGAYGQNATNLKLSASRDNWFFGATAEWDLFNGMRTVERVRAAERKLEEARQQLEKTRHAVDFEVQRAFLEWQEARARETVTESAQTAAEEAFRLVTEQYQQGVVVVTRYLEAEAARAGARARAVTARYDARRAEFALRRAVGDWQEGGFDD